MATKGPQWSDLHADLAALDAAALQAADPAAAVGRALRAGHAMDQLLEQIEGVKR